MYVCKDSENVWLKLKFFYKLYDFPQIVRSDAIWGQLCEIAPSCNIRWPVLANLSLPSKPHFSFQRISCNLLQAIHSSRISTYKKQA